MSRRLVFVEGSPGGLHIWVGGWGLHLFWPDVWKSRPDRCRNWQADTTEAG